MKTYIKLAVALCCGFSISSCSNDLTEKVFSSVTEQSYNYTEKDFGPTVAAPYRYLRMIRHDDFWATNEFSGDQIVNPPNTSGWDDGGIYRVLHYHTWTAEHDIIRKGWDSFYGGIILCNTILAQIESGSLPAPSETVKAAGAAEVRALRAYYYWLICDNWGDAPLITAPTFDLPAKSMRKDIFDFIESELLAAIPGLSEEQGGGMYGRMNKWAAKTLLANLYLNAVVYVGEAHWNECIEQCNDIINSRKLDLSPNYNTSFRTRGVESSPEIVFAIPYERTFAGGQSLHMHSWHGELQKKFGLEATPWGSGATMGVTQFIDTYHENDTRLDDTWLMGPQFASDGTPLMCIYDKELGPLTFNKDVKDGNFTPETDGYRMFKFEVQPGTSGDSNTDFPLHRYSEVLMMKAECLLRTNQPGAGALVTEVRARNFENAAEAAVTDDQLKADTSYKYGYVENYLIVDPGDSSPVEFGRMLDELGWEFAWEMHRRRDLIRFGVYSKKSWLSHKPQGDYRTVFPIPQRALTSNLNLKQNPNYE